MIKSRHCSKHLARRITVRLPRTRADWLKLCRQKASSTRSAVRSLNSTSPGLNAAWMKQLPSIFLARPAARRQRGCFRELKRACAAAKIARPRLRAERKFVKIYEARLGLPERGYMLTAWLPPGLYG